MLINLYNRLTYETLATSTSAKGMRSHNHIKLIYHMKLLMTISAKSITNTCITPDMYGTLHVLLRWGGGGEGRGKGGGRGGGEGGGRRGEGENQLFLEMYMY